MLLCFNWKNFKNVLFHLNIFDNTLCPNKFFVWVLQNIYQNHKTWKINESLFTFWLSSADLPSIPRIFWQKQFQILISPIGDVTFFIKVSVGTHGILFCFHQLIFQDIVVWDGIDPIFACICACPCPSGRMDMAYHGFEVIGGVADTSRWSLLILLEMQNDFHL